MHPLSIQQRLPLSASLLSVLLLFQPCMLAAPLDRKHFDELNQQATRAYRQAEWNTLRTILLRIQESIPARTPDFLMRMAAVEAHLGNKQQSLEWLNRYAAMGLSRNLEVEPVFQTLSTETGYQPLLKRMKDNRAPLQKAELVCALSAADTMPEDLAYDQVAQRFLVSSIQHHTVYALSVPRNDGSCTLNSLAPIQAMQRWPVMALSSDPTRKLLWFTASAMEGFPNVPQEENGKSSLYAANSRSGAIERRFDLSTGQAGVLGDMSISSDGAVYVTDSQGGGVYRVRGNLKTARLEQIATGFLSPQTPVVASDHKRLFVADYAMGIAIVDLTAPSPPSALNYLPHPADIAVTGLDGLCLFGDSLYGIQNGTNPVRIMRYRLDTQQTRILSAEVIEQANDRLGEPTHILAHDGWLYVIANVGWDKVDDHGKLNTGQHFTPPVLLRFH
jgi:hypothetical protein